VVYDAGTAKRLRSRHSFSKPFGGRCQKVPTSDMPACVGPASGTMRAVGRSEDFALEVLEPFGAVK
jgi:hypothetical protein